MNANTNGFNYSSDYQGSKGPYIVVILFVLFGLMAMSSFEKKGPVNDNGYDNYYDDNNNYDDQYDNNNYDDQYDNSVDDNFSDDNNNDINNNTDDSNHNKFDFYQLS